MYTYFKLVVVLFPVENLGHASALIFNQETGRSGFFTVWGFQHPFSQRAHSGP